jgi:mannosyltransferase
VPNEGRENVSPSQTTTPTESGSVQPIQPRLLRGPLTRSVTDPLLVGLLAVVVGAIAVSRPSFWGDEAATISASTRSLPDLARLVSSVDAVPHPITG